MTSERDELDDPEDHSAVVRERRHLLNVAYRLLRQEVAATRYAFPTEAHPSYRAHVNVPAVTMASPPSIPATLRARGRVTLHLAERPATDASSASSW